MPHRLTPVLAEIAATLKNRLQQRPREEHTGPLLLQHLIPAQIPPLEDYPAGGRVRVHTLRKPITQAKPLPRKKPAGLNVYAIDSSSRGLQAPGAYALVSAVSISAWRPPLVYDNPPVYSYPWEPEEEPPAFAETIPGSRPQGYSPEAALDEARVKQENWALAALAEHLDQGSIVLVDGPVFLIPSPHHLRQLPQAYRDNWLRLLEARAMAVRSLEDRGVPVIGVVKRIEHSRLIERTQELLALASRCLGEEWTGPDSLALDTLLRCTARKPGRVYLTPRLQVDVEGIEGWGTGKIVEYMVVPRGRWQTGPARAYRLEYTGRSLELLEELGLQPHHVIALDSLARGSLEPLTIAHSDRRAKNITRALSLHLYHELRAQGIPVSYSSIMQMIIG